MKSGLSAAADVAPPANETKTPPSRLRRSILFPRIADAPYHIGHVVGDQQATILSNGQTAGAAPDFGRVIGLAIPEASEEILEAAISDAAVFHVDAHHLS